MGRPAGSQTGKMERLVVLCIAAVFLPTVYSAAENIEWCYHLPTCNDANWPVIAPQYCSGHRQSPINIRSEDAVGHQALGEFTFTGFDNRFAYKTMSNTGKTVKLDLNPGVSISGGGLSETYDTLQLHVHWGAGARHPGSEHTVDGKRYPMEVHIVNIKSSHNGNITAALADPTGLAALGFLIEDFGYENEELLSRRFRFLLLNITEKGDSINFPPGVSLFDTLHGVDYTKYYRYMGSLTTPTCNEAVVWTLFKDPIRVSSQLLDAFSQLLHVGNSSSPLMTNTFRNIQPMNGRKVFTQAKRTVEPTEDPDDSTEDDSILDGVSSLGGAYKTVVALALVSLVFFGPYLGIPDQILYML